ncbi:unnamed protein product [Acanthoscelides obtectus]|uniref:Uncharacterized protein n=1 Tax=Acanthoscelides obtectus TaxID=200917 RepID=A0A9P0PJA2_ACAOB|nr:unnamed protein product [Acanthoscelides obtectus]CAK1651618.1 hypothetical protein AOBTE_LOCUS17359 [Acanthoscelides obtectus]
MDGKVVATKGVKDVYTLTSCENGENVTVIACCNAGGDKETPSKVLSEIHPVPKPPKNLSKRQQTAIILTSPKNFEKRKLLANKRNIKVEAESKKLKQAKTKATDMKKRDNPSRVKGEQYGILTVKAHWEVCNDELSKQMLL